MLNIEFNKVFFIEKKSTLALSGGKGCMNFDYAASSFGADEIGLGRGL
jgi:hypothetical protein